MSDQHPQDAVTPQPSPTPPQRAVWTPPPVPKVTYLPAPSGPNWGLVLVGLFFGLVAAGIVANQTAGFQASDLTTVGPTVFVIGGLLCALVGMAGIVRRRRR